MISSNQYKKLQYQYEVLLARYEIRDHYVNEMIQEVYQNIGQVLSLVRIQLSLLSHNYDAVKEKAAEPSELIGKVIQDLRNMCRSLDPEKEFLVKSGLIRALEQELKLLNGDQVKASIEVKGVPYSLPIGIELIVFRMLQEILFYIVKEHKKQAIVMTIAYGKNGVTFMMQYTGKPIECKELVLPVDDTSFLKRLPLPQRAELIDVKLQVTYSKANQTCIKLVVPFKKPLYE